MKKITNIKFNELENKKHRFCFNDIKAFVDNNEQINGKILVLYGLRRTGKTTLMHQLIKEYKDKPEYQNKWRFYELTTEDVMNDLYVSLEEDNEKGVKLVCIDEITKAKDFMINSSALANIYAKFYDMQIVVAGTDSLAFNFAEKDELFDRIYKIRTTHIPYAEHSQVLGTIDIDNYIEFGGLMKKGIKNEDIVIIKNENGEEEKFIKDGNQLILYKDFMEKYVDGAVSSNIINSIKKSSINHTILKNIPEDELRTIIAKLVELYNGIFNEEKMQNDLSNVSVNGMIHLLDNNDKKIKDYVKLINKNKIEIIKEFKNLIYADTEINTKITNEIVEELKYYLINMDLLSSIQLREFTCYDETAGVYGWEEKKFDNKNNKNNKKKKKDENKSFYIIQPAIKYFHLQEGLHFIKTNIYYEDGPDYIKDKMLKKLDTQIKGFMLEQIITFDVSKALSNGLYNIFKPSFSIKNKNLGEYDLLIRQNNNYYAFEIKHNNDVYEDQDNLLINKKVTEFMNWKFGNRIIAAVLYRGEPRLNENKTPYFNISDFLIAVNKYKDMDLVINHLIKDLKYENGVNFNNLIPYFDSIINKENEETSFNFYKNIIIKNPFEFIYITNNNLPASDKREFPFKDILDYYIELVDIAVNLQPILLKNVDFKHIVSNSGLINENHLNFYMNLCQKTVNKLPLTIKDVNIEYFPNKELYKNLWETAISKDAQLIKYLDKNNLEQPNIYVNLFFRAYKKDKSIKIYFDDTILPSNYKTKDDLFQKFDELMTKSNNNDNYDFFKKKS